MQFALNCMYFVCVYPGCKTLLPKIVACEGRKEGNLYFGKYTLIQDDRYNTILLALETITKTAMRSLS